MYTWQKHVFDTLDLPENVMQTVDFTVWELALKLKFDQLIYFASLIPDTKNIFIIPDTQNISDWMSPNSTNVFSRCYFDLS